MERLVKYFAQPRENLELRGESVKSQKCTLHFSVRGDRHRGRSRREGRTHLARPRGRVPQPNKHLLSVPPSGYTYSTVRLLRRDQPSQHTKSTPTLIKSLYHAVRPAHVHSPHCPPAHRSAIDPSNPLIMYHNSSSTVRFTCRRITSKSPSSDPAESHQRIHPRRTGVWYRCVLR